MRLHGDGSHARRLAIAAAAVSLGGLVAGCMPQPATTQARAISDLYGIFLVAAAIVAAIVWGLITWAIVRYRRATAPDAPLPPQTHDNRLLEAIWTALPILTVIGLFALTFATINQVQAVSPDPGVDVHVEAFQWQWRFVYTSSGVTVTGQVGGRPELVVPVGRPVHVLLTSDDVNHAFYVPAFLFKRDAIPGHPNTFDFTVMNPGVYDGQCAEFCGVFHYQMTFAVRAVTPAAFASWLASAGASASPSAGGSAAATPLGPSAAAPASPASPPPSASPS